MIGAYVQAVYVANKQICDLCIWLAVCFLVAYGYRRLVWTMKGDQVGTITINGQTFSGNNIQLKDGRLIIDGEDIGTDGSRVLEIHVYGDVENVTSDKSVSVTGRVLNNVEAGGSVSASDIGGDVKANGSVNCDDVKGSVYANGSVNCDDVGGEVKAGGSVRHG